MNHLDNDPDLNDSIDPDTNNSNNLMKSKTYNNYRAEWIDVRVLGDKNNKITINLYKNNELVHKLEKKYATYDVYVLLEWFDIGGKTFLVSNHIHGCLSILSADSGETIHTTKFDDVFILSHRLFDDNKYLYVSGWFWSPVPIRAIFHITDMLTTPDYEPTYISCDDFDDYDALDPGISLFGCASCEDFLANHDQIFKDLGIQNSTKKFNENRCNDTLLKRFTDMTSNDLLRSMFSDDRKKFYINVYGESSGSRLARYDDALYSKIDFEFDFIHEAFAKIIFRPFNDSLPFSEINLRFEIYSDIGDLNVYVTHKLILSKSTTGYEEYMMDNNSPLNVMIKT